MQVDAADQLRRLLENIPGLEVEVGLMTVGGRVESLARLIRKYEQLHGGDIQVLREGLAVGEPEATRRLAHSLKGAAGFLGLTSIQALAGALEAALRPEGPSGEIEGLLAAFEGENDRVCAAIRALPAPE
ncbi:Hpt domain-containing protein [Geothrix sp.]|jgi:HPt (histidine-containing phosphotransfer) domain-containing protein|uniref:Hpt domain-containing protein n=1 Tax=Geothrix sp. TaxID=1962974 RepID=UPI0025BAAE92|nr:Hpt domain-containing protein [Geothrix sp.]